MESQREVEKKYNKILQHESIKGEVAPNRVNCYTCEKCGHITKTIDIDKGVTPFMSSCEMCKGTATSSFYDDIAPNQEPTIEWYRPTLKQTLKMRQNFNLLSHVLDGGLCSRIISQ